MEYAFRALGYEYACGKYANSSLKLFWRGIRWSALIRVVNAPWAEGNRRPARVFQADVSGEHPQIAVRDAWRLVCSFTPGAATSEFQGRAT